MSTSDNERQRIVPEEKVLSETELEGLKREIAEHEGDRKETDQFYDPGHQYGDETNEVIRRYKRVVERGTAPELTREQRVKMERQMGVDKEWLQKNMVPKSHFMLRPGPDPEFRKAVNFMARKEMSQEFQEVAQRFKNNARRLHGKEAPELSNLETIRPDKT